MKRLMVLLASLLFVFHSVADTKTENTELARINSVLNAVYPLIDAAEKAAPKNQRVKFRYDWLRRDIARIQAGIAQKINQKNFVPNVVKPIVPVYREAQQSSNNKHPQELP